METRLAHGTQARPKRMPELRPISGEDDARQCLGSIIAKLGQTPAWRLRHMQAVVDRTLIPNEVV